MKKKKSDLPKQSERFAKAQEAMSAGAKMRDASKIAPLPLSTFHYRLKKQSRLPMTRTYLSPTEENVIVQLITRFSDRGYSMSREDVSLVVQDIVQAFPQSRKSKLSFVNGKPARKFLRLFAQRHSSEIKFGRASEQEQARWRATNAQNLTHHFAEIECLIRVHNLDASRIANMDETGSTASKKCRQSARNKTFTTGGRPAERQSPEFKNIKRITMMPVVFANGDVGRSLFVVQGTRVTYRTTLHDGMETMETLADCLPRGSVITTRQDVASVDLHNFLQWGRLFAEGCRDLTAGGRQVLFILDGYRGHMMYPVLRLFDASGIIVYALPAHTSGSTQALDASVFGSFKEHLRVSIEEYPPRQQVTHVV